MVLINDVEIPFLKIIPGLKNLTVFHTNLFFAFLSPTALASR